MIKFYPNEISKRMMMKFMVKSVASNIKISIYSRVTSKKTSSYAFSERTMRNLFGTRPRNYTSKKNNIFHPIIKSIPITCTLTSTKIQDRNNPMESQIKNKKWKVYLVKSIKIKKMRNPSKSKRRNSRKM